MTRRQSRRALLGSAATGLSLALGGCLSGGDETPATASPTGSPATSVPPTPTESRSPTPTAEPTPTATETPEPTTTAVPGERVGPIKVAPTNGSVSVPDVSIQRTGDGPVGDVDIQHSVGTVEIHGRSVPALTYISLPWGYVDRTLNQTLAVASDALYVIWFYCSDDGSIAELWYQGTDTPMERQIVSAGSWTKHGGFASADVSFPAVSIDRLSLVEGYTVDAGGLTVNESGRGSLSLGGSNDVFAFEEVDCSRRCGGSGWYELHLLLWNADRGRLAFGIAYLYPDGRNGPNVHLSYVLGIPNLWQPGQQQYDGSWSAP